MPIQRPTNSGLQTRGTLWAGFDPTTSSLVAGVFMVSVMFTFGAISVLKVSWVFAVPVCFLLPNLLLLTVIFALVLGKPPRHLRDWLDSRVLERNGVDLRRVPEPVAPEIEA
jgi:hypothetical protein